jgi:diaminopimelate epimerase
MRFHKYHALGNDYLVMDPADFSDGLSLSGEAIQTICHRNFGVGSDGILEGPLPPEGGVDALGRLRIHNPDGSEAEKSGNGLRIFCRYLYDTARVVDGEEFALQTLGGRVQCRVLEGGRQVRVEMGRVSFSSADIPVTGGVEREVLEETMKVGEESLTFSAATIGNPHCVIARDEISEEETRRLGPLIEHAPIFPNRANVQFLKVLDRRNLQIEIWERGAGYTLASGSSSSAAAAVARRLGLCDENITMHMPGGQLQIEMASDYSIIMTGPVTRVAEGDFFTEALG